MVGVNRGWVYMVVGANRRQNAVKATAKRCETQAKHRRRARRTTTTTTTNAMRSDENNNVQSGRVVGGVKSAKRKIRAKEDSKHKMKSCTNNLNKQPSKRHASPLHVAEGRRIPGML